MAEMMRLIALATTLALAAQPAVAAKFHFCWIGGAGYTMRGIIEFPDALLNTGIITQTQVTNFAIFGYHDGIPVGAWRLADLTPTTTWEMYFDTDTLAFPVGGSSFQRSYQAWNANGTVDNCGAGGFGFNGGNLWQDVCIDNTYVEPSSIDPFTPLQAFREDVPLTCDAALPMM